MERRQWVTLDGGRGWGRGRGEGEWERELSAMKSKKHTKYKKENPSTKVPISGFRPLNWSQLPHIHHYTGNALSIFQSVTFKYIIPLIFTGFTQIVQNYTQHADDRPYDFYSSQWVFKREYIWNKGVGVDMKLT